MEWVEVGFAYLGMALTYLTIAVATLTLVCGLLAGLHNRDLPGGTTSPNASVGATSHTTHANATRSQQP